MLEPKRLVSSHRVTSAILDHVRLAAFLVEPGGKFLYCNAAGATALKDGDCLKQSGDLLCAAHANDNIRLRAAISIACANDERQTIMISDVHHRAPNMVTVIPFGDEDIAENGSAIVFVQTCETTGDVFATTVRQLFRLSAAETAIAAALVSGADVEHIAEMRNAKITTVRTQIAAMLLKTRTRRQTELIALFSRICSLP